MMDYEVVKGFFWRENSNPKFNHALYPQGTLQSILLYLTSLTHQTHDHFCFLN